LLGDGNLESITQTIVTGVQNPKEHPVAMPPVGGVTLSRTDLNAVADFVWAFGHQKHK
jgi:hypothetical protein